MKVICFGDSNTYGYDPRSFLGDRYCKDARWVDLLAAKTGWNVINQGENGRQIPRNPVSFPYDTNLLIVMLGTNDLLQSCDVQQTAQKMGRFISALTIDRNKILLIAPPPMARGEWVSNQELIDKSIMLGKLYEKLAEHMGVRFANAGEWCISLAYDGVHFTEDGHKTFSDALYNMLNSFWSDQKQPIVDII